MTYALDSEPSSPAQEPKHATTSALPIEDVLDVEDEKPERPSVQLRQFCDEGRRAIQALNNKLDALIQEVKSLKTQQHEAQLTTFMSEPDASVEAPEGYLEFPGPTTSSVERVLDTLLTP